MKVKIEAQNVKKYPIRSFSYPGVNNFQAHKPVLPKAVQRASFADEEDGAGVWRSWPPFPLRRVGLELCPGIVHLQGSSVLTNINIFVGK